MSAALPPSGLPLTRSCVTTTRPNYPPIGVPLLYAQGMRYSATTQRLCPALVRNKCVAGTVNLIISQLSSAYNDFTHSEHMFPLNMAGKSCQRLYPTPHFQNDRQSIKNSLWVVEGSVSPLFHLRVRLPPPPTYGISPGPPYRYVVDTATYVHISYFKLSKHT